MTIDWWTFALQAINFLILAWLLKRFLYQPVRQVIERREALSAEAARKLEDDRKAAQAAKAEFEAKAAEAASTRRQLKEEALAETAADRERIVAEARTEAAGITDAARSAVAEERQRAMAELKGDVLELAADMAGKLLVRAAADIDDEPFLKDLEERIGEFDDSELRRLEAAGGSGSSGPTIVTARPLDKAARAAWQKRISKLLAGDGALRFETDPALIAGAELRLGNTTVRSTWASQLRQARAAMADEK
jgi:F-type H+-transporting ATPase subunit b